MGYSRIALFEDEVKKFYPKIKNYVGYCRKCLHADCEEIRKLRNTKCNICNNLMKADESYYVDENKNPQHVRCVLTQVK